MVATVPAGNFPAGVAVTPFPQQLMTGCFVGRMIGSMKVKTSITLSPDLLEAIDARAGRGRTRSEFIEAALRAVQAPQRKKLKRA